MFGINSDIIFLPTVCQQHVFPYIKAAVGEGTLASGGDRGPLFIHSEVEHRCAALVYLFQVAFC